MKKINEEDVNTMIKKLQDNLPLIRETGNWSMVEFGKMVGLSRQAVWNLENGKATLTPVQYIAIRSMLDYQIKEHPNGERIKAIVGLTLDDNDIPENLKETAIAFVAGTNKAKLDKKTFKDGLTVVLGTVCVASLLAGTITWISKFLKK